MLVSRLAIGGFVLPSGSSPYEVELRRAVRALTMPVRLMTDDVARNVGLIGSMRLRPRRMRLQLRLPHKFSFDHGKNMLVALRFGDYSAPTAAIRWYVGSRQVAR